MVLAKNTNKSQEKNGPEFHEWTVVGRMPKMRAKRSNLFPIFFGFPSFLACGLQIYAQETDVQFVSAVWLHFQ